MTESPVKLLIFLLLAAASISGWLYGWHWKQVAAGTKPTHEEKLIISLQDQLDHLRAENDRLTENLNALEDRLSEQAPAKGNTDGN